MTIIKFKEKEENDLESTAFNNVFEPTFNDSFPPDPIPPVWEIGDLFEREENLETTMHTD